MDYLLKNKVLFLLVATVAMVVLKGILIYLADIEYIGWLFSIVLSFVNTGCSLLTGFIFGYFFSEKKNGAYKYFLILAFISYSIAIFMINYYIFYHFNNEYFSNFSDFLRQAIHAEPETSHGKHDAVELLLFIFQQIAELFDLKIAGLIGMIFWYLFSLIWIAIGFLGGIEFDPDKKEVIVNGFEQQETKGVLNK